MKPALSQPDPNVRIPDAVKAAAQRSEDIFHAARGTKPEDSPPANGEGQPVEGGEQGAGEGVGKDAKGTDQESKAKPSEAPPPPAPASEQEVTTRGNGEPVNWEQRYNSMKGHFDRANRDLRELSNQVTSLQRVIATMQAPPAPAAPAPEPQGRFMITAEEEQEYGPEFLKVVEKKAGQIASELTRDLRNEVDGLKSQLSRVGGHIATDARERMEQQLDQDIPMWREVNRNQNFLRWLQLPDVYSGAIRHELLKAAYERNSTPQVKAFFNGFLAEEAAVDPANSGQDNRDTPPSPNGSKQAAPPKVPLENMAAPGRAKTGAGNSSSSEKPIITRREVSEFYAEVAAGKYRGNEAEKERLERQIFEAQRDGRLR